jgi:hypothetical protein
LLFSPDAGVLHHLHPTLADQHCSFQVLWRKELENINQDLVRQKINGVHLKKLALDESKTLAPVDIYRIYLK